jgi:hypothetical protein
VGDDPDSDSKDFKQKDYLRIDVIGFGDTRLEPAPADYQLRDAILAGDAGAIRAAVVAGAELRTVPDHSCSALGLALHQRSEGDARRPVVAALLELGADINEPDGEPEIPAALDSFFTDEAELIDVLEVLLAHGADVNARDKKTLSRFESPLHTVARKGWVAIAKFLVSKGADACATNALGHVPRQSAEAAADSIREFGEADAKATYAPIISFLTDAERGGGDLDWKQDAEESSRRELRRRREMKEAVAGIGAGLKALSLIMGKGPSPEKLAEAMDLIEPGESPDRLL